MSPRKCKVEYKTASDYSRRWLLVCADYAAALYTATAVYTATAAAEFSRACQAPGVHWARPPGSKKRKTVRTGHGHARPGGMGVRVRPGGHHARERR